MRIEIDEENDTRQVLCERCRKFVQIADIKYLPKGNETKMALCRSCLKSFNIPASQVKKPVVQTGPAMESFLCTRCNYKFKVSKARDASLRCPYCGKSDRIDEQKSHSTEVLLKE